MNYISQIFTPTSLEHAKNICLTPDDEDPNKFVNETNFFIDFVNEKQLIRPQTHVADFGCGMGRISKQLIERIGCKVTGFDISYPMLLTATNYINSDKFAAKKYKKDFKEDLKETFDVVIATFVLQHSEHPEWDLSFIKNILKPNGVFILVNEEKRFIPIDICEGNVVWHDDEIDIKQATSTNFNFVGEYEYYNRPDKCLTVWSKQ